MWFIGVEVEQETSASPPKKNPGSAPGSIDEHPIHKLASPVNHLWQMASFLFKATTKRAIKTSNLFCNTALQRVEIATLRDIQIYLVTNRVCRNKLHVLVACFTLPLAARHE